MDLNKTLQDLYAEKDRVERAIASLESLHTAERKEAPAADHPGRRGRHAMGARERLEVSERMRRYWAARREGAGKTSEKLLTRTAGSP